MSASPTDSNVKGNSQVKENFHGLGLNEWMVNQCLAVGIKKPTPIQINCIPAILKGHDCIGCAKTGSGKTAAFALPILQKLCEDPFGIFALVITPTRELAFQICEQFRVLGKPINVRVTVITGGMDMVAQGSDLAVQPHIVISTPGRLSDHITSCDTFSLKRIRFLVLDEADRLLEDDFGDQLKVIFDRLPKRRQTLLFSATITDTLRELQEAALNTPFVWMAPYDTVTVDELDQRYMLMPADVKDAYFVHMLHKFTKESANGSVMIFTNTCKYCQILGMILHELGLEAVVLHSQMKQSLRLASLARFKSSQTRILIATDLASRGLDIPTVDLIVNHNVPTRAKDYVHRVGRTARAGRGGMAVTLVTQFDIKLVHSIESFTNTKMKEYEIEENEVLKILTEVAVARREAEIKLDEQDFGEKREIHKRTDEILLGLKRANERSEKPRKKRRGGKKKRLDAPPSTTTSTPLDTPTE